MSLLSDRAKQIVSKTILAADESSKTIQKRFDSIGLTSTPEVNRAYREMLFSTPHIEEYVSGVILYEETLKQSDSTAKPFPHLLLQKGIAPGIKVDQGTTLVEGNEPDTNTLGLDGLSDRLKEYKKQGAQFAKWRALFTITDAHPIELTVKQNAEDLAKYAKVCQNEGIVPIVEPEVLMDGEHTFERCEEVTKHVLTAVFTSLNQQGVELEGMILKPNMITSGTKNTSQKSVKEVALKTLDVLHATVPPLVPGIAFLSGGQSPDLATDHLREMNRQKNKHPDQYPWRLTASYGRALQGEALEVWHGKTENIEQAQKTFLERARKVYNASIGK